MAQAGDILRRLVYPLLLPTIVLAVWAHAWALKNDNGPVPIAPASSRAEVVPSVPTFPDDVVRVRGYGLISADDSLAAAGGDDARE